ncbi:hypothetical protein JKP88DRAFT_166949 [Tribonema minus]|uniref:Uncharacterized protein n=1 Tax=Tribonema minus TaxID=303371 RepID=A0A836CDM4_9STRA|nr:hypothetical protein JKP88DRAFT_166949 [Tribonema minus]
MATAAGQASLLAAVEAKRSKIEVPPPTLKKLEREAERKKEFWNQNVIIKCVDANGIAVPNCSWRLQRRKLTPDFIKLLCQRCPLAINIDYLRDAATAEVVWLEDMQAVCKPAPWAYTVIPKEERRVADDRADAHYVGDTHLMLLQAPLRTENEEFDEDVEISGARDLIAQMTQQMEALDKKLGRVAAVQHGHTEAQQEAAREAMYATIVMEKEILAASLKASRAYFCEEAADVLASITEARRATPFALRRSAIDAARATCTYLITVGGAAGPALEDALVAKRNWPGIKLAVAHAENPAWAGRGTVPDGSKAYLPCYTRHGANMRGAALCRLAHGFGQHRAVRPLRRVATAAGGARAGNTKTAAPPSQRSGGGAPSPRSAARAGDGSSGGGGGGSGEEFLEHVPFCGARFAFYSGQFHEGTRTGAGVLYGEGGALWGAFEGGHARGACGEHRSDGTRLAGDWSAAARLPVEPSNPYAIGVLDGAARIVFPDGAVYEGEVSAGRVSGEGTYCGPGGEITTGTFVDGVLEGWGEHQDTLGTVWEGSWRNGALHGQGRVASAKWGSYAGDWEGGVRCGKGTAVLRDGSMHTGFYLDGERCGPGVLRRGNVKTVYDAHTGGQRPMANRVYEGTFRGGGLEGGGAVTVHRTRRMHCVAAREGDRWGRGAVRTARREAAARRAAAARREFLARLEALVRATAEAEKRRVARKQVRRAEADIVADYHEPLTLEHVRSVSAKSTSASSC